MICERHCNALISWTLFSLILCSPTHAQSISTNTPVPPLQWINITGLIKGSTAAPPLVDASIGYYAGTRTLLVFGGESAQGLPSSQTFLLDLDSLTWSSPPSGNTPPARSAAISGDDIAASYRTAHIVIGGKDSSGNALSDVWEFDYISQIWQQVSLSEGGPSGRYGAVGGYDSRTAAATVPNSPYPNNTFYLAGGIDGSSVSPLSDVWQLNVTGTLSSNNLNDVYGSWEQIPMSGSSAPSKVGAAGAVVSQSTDQIIAAIGGCTTSSASNASCAQADSYIINTQMDSVEALKPCPAPRFGATVVQNHNEFNGAFNTQVFLLLGTVNASLWSDGGGLDRGEVDVFDITTGSWTRILPAGDPGSSGGEPAFPSPRQGAVALSSSQTLVGESRNTASDTIVFGGRDAAGNYLSEVWILRAYNATLTQSNASWSGFGNGQLTGGPDANGQGVTIQYMTQCASPLSPQATQTSSYPSSTPSGIGPGSPTTTSPSSSSPTARYNTSVTHKSLSPISIALVLPAVIIFRLSSPPVSPVNSPQPLGRRMALFYLAAVVGLAAYGIGIAGLATSFTTITSTSSLIKRSSSNVLKTVHGKAGLALFAGFYGLVPLLYLYSIYHRRRLAKRTNKDVNGIGDGRSRVNSSETAEKMGFLNGRAGSPLRQSMDGPSQETHVTEPRPRVRSWGGLGPLTVFPGRRSSESGLDSTGASAPSHRSFEVTNRPVRTRRASGNSLAAFSDPRATGTPRNLSDMSWFDRRRSLGTVGELDYALGNLSRRGPDPGTPGTTALDMTSTSGLMTPNGRSVTLPEMPEPFDILLHLLFHALLLGLCILILVALWTRAPKAAFIVFLIGTVLFYISLVVLAWYGKPRRSVLTVVISRLRGKTPHTGPPTGTPSPSRPLSTTGSEVPFPTDQRGPYQHHHPPFRTTLSVGLDHEYPTSISHGHGTAEVDDDDGEDEDTRQRRIEEEMSRRDVSIVTVPRRKLFLTNPEEDRS